MQKINNLTLQLNFLKEILVQFEKFLNLSYQNKKKSCESKFLDLWEKN